MSANHYDVVHAHHVEGLMAAVAARGRRRVPVVFDAHTTLESELPSYSRHGRTLLERLGRSLDTFLPARADHVIAISEEIRAKFTDHCGVAADRISVVANGVEESFFVGPGERANTGEAGPTLVFGGNLASYQGIDLLLASFAKALQQRPDLRLRLITEDSLDAYEQLAGQLGVRQRIELVKASLDELPHLLAQASVLVNPRTEGDGTPQKVLNYMAAGRPIVSFAGTARHLVDDRDALIVPNGDTDAFARAVLRLCADDDLAARIGGTAQRTARAEFTWARTADRVEQIYASLVPARS